MANDNRSSLEVFKEVVRHGIALVSVDYRLNSEAAYPDQIYDVKGAVRFIRAHAKEYNIDPNRIAISGTSAGAHLALLWLPPITILPMKAMWAATPNTLVPFRLSSIITALRTC